MSTMLSAKPTAAELDQAKQVYNDVNDYLEYLTDIIQAKVQEVQEDSEDSEDSDYEELSPNVAQFLNDYKEYISSLPQVHKQLVNSHNDSSSSTMSSKLHKRFWRYSQLQLLPPNLLNDFQKLCEAKLDRDVQVSPLFSTSLPILDTNGNNEKLLTNEASPSVTLLKAQLDKHTTRELERNRIVIRTPNYSFDEPIEEKRVVFVVKKSTAVIVAPPTPPTVVESPKEQELEIEEKNSTINEKSEVVFEKVLSEKNTKKKAIDFDFLSKFLSTNKFGFSKSQISQLSSLIWT